MKILVINAGSSSLKYQLIDMETESVLAKGLCERIGIDGHLKHTPLIGGKPVFDEDLAMPTHSEAIAAVIDKLTSAEYGVVASMKEIDAVGHRVVHGGEKFASSVKIDDAVMAALEECIPFAPLHNPANITGIEACRKVMGDVPMVAVFDTAFHQTMPGKAYMYAIPYEYYQNDGIRRYGFHGTSHKYVSAKGAEFAGIDLNNSKIITCHLGNGSSITAVENGKCVDTSMGFTPLEGMIMGTRCGSLDPDIVTYIMEKENLTTAQMSKIMNKQSGFLGLSGLSSDARDLNEAANAGNARAKVTLKKLNYDIIKLIGAYTAAMNGVDLIIFTGGIGENNPRLRRRICENLTYLGLKFDYDRNAGEKADEMMISLPDSKVKVAVIATNEELMIARDTMHIVLDSQE